ncbi:MAG: N-acetylmuramoyl-L-alanine amidase [Chloroflexi bacterium]|nr:N-acetylmuramoyl-L-alanine amidase [Chloroflexota bacterium]
MPKGLRPLPPMTITSPPHLQNIPAKPVVQRLPKPRPIRIGIISGHRGNDSGAVCADGLTEAQVNETIADMVLSDLQAQGIRAEKLDEFDARLDNYYATAVVSIHADSCDYINDLATGFKLAGSGYTDSTELSICVEQAYRQSTQMEYHANTITPDMSDYLAFRQIALACRLSSSKSDSRTWTGEMITTNASFRQRVWPMAFSAFLSEYKTAVTASN